jgi:uracil-DNA glycosylase
MLIQSILIEPSWKRMLEEEFGKPYFQKLSAFAHQEYMTRNIYPAAKDIFRAFDICAFDKVTVVILGQDPYHGTQQANGLSFAVHTGIPLPPSLRNIFKEIENDVGITPLVDGDLSRWAQQGVLLLNATLTVQADNPGSHQNKGWESFTDTVIKTLSDQKEHVVFILWGNYAKDKGRCINRNRHLVIESPHPSPFSAHNGFFGSKPFSKTNEYLSKYDKPLIEWG